MTCPLLVGPLLVSSVMVDAARRTACTQDGQRLALSAAEFSLLAALVRANGVVVGSSELHRAVLNRPFKAGDRALSRVVFGLRHKLPPDEDGMSLIRCIPAVGWIRAGVPAPRRELQHKTGLG